MGAVVGVVMVSGRSVVAAQVVVVEVVVVVVGDARTVVAGARP